MKTKDIYFKTMKFTWLKLLVGAALTLIVTILFAVFVGIGTLFSGEGGGLFDSIPGMSIITNIAQLFIGIALGYVDECCLGYTFVNKEQSAVKSACDGVCIYFQNTKRLLKNAAMITLIVVVSTFLAWLIPFAVIGGLCAAFNWSRFVGFIIAIVIAMVIKAAFIDPFILIKTMVSYMEVAPSTVLSVDLYGKLCKLSSKFKSLFKKAENEAEVAM